MRGVAFSIDGESRVELFAPESSAIKMIAVENVVGVKKGIFH